MLEDQPPETLPADWVFQHCQRSTLVELMIIQRWALHVAKEEVTKLSHNLDSVLRAMRFLLTAVDEMHTGVFPTVPPKMC